MLLQCLQQQNLAIIHIAKYMEVNMMALPLCPKTPSSAGKDLLLFLPLKTLPRACLNVKLTLNSYLLFAALNDFGLNTLLLFRSHPNCLSRGTDESLCSENLCRILKCCVLNGSGCFWRDWSNRYWWLKGMTQNPEHPEHTRLLPVKRGHTWYPSACGQLSNIPVT